MVTSSAATRNSRCRIRECISALQSFRKVLSEYGITPVNRPIHPNRILREAGIA